MKETLETLWNDYFSEECSVLETEEEKALLKKALELHEKANKLLTKDQIEAVEKYVETIYDTQFAFGKKAFLRGCQFATSFLLEAGNFGKK